MSGLKESGKNDNLEFIDLERTYLPETEEQEHEEPLPLPDKDIDTNIPGKHVAIALHNWVADSIIKSELKNHNPPPTTISIDRQDKDPTEQLRENLRTSDTDPTIKSIDVLVIEANLKTAGGDVGNKKANQECIKIIRETLKRNPNAIIILVTQTPAAAAEILETFKDHNVYYGDKKENPFSIEHSENPDMLNNRRINLGPLSKMLPDIATLHKKNMTTNTTSKDDETSDNTLPSSPHHPETFSSDLSPRSVFSPRPSSHASPDASPRTKLRSVRIAVEGARLTQDSQPKPESLNTKLRSFFCCIFPFSIKSRKNRNRTTPV